jgi:hypothetical protein
MLQFLLGYTLASGGLADSSKSADTIAARADARESLSKTRNVEARLDTLELACAAMWRLLKEQGFSDEALIAAIEKVDEEDGMRDGRIGRASADCPRCGRRLLTRFGGACAWCGAAIPKKPF